MEAVLVTGVADGFVARIRVEGAAAVADLEAVAWMWIARIPAGGWTANGAAGGSGIVVGAATPL